MRHASYAVDQPVRDEWMICMPQAITEQVTDADLRDGLIHTFAQMADHMVNTESQGGCPAQIAH